MPKEISYTDLENQFGESMAVISSQYNLMWGIGENDEFDPEMIRKIGRGGFAAARKAEQAFNDLLTLYISDKRKQKIK